MAQWMNLQWIKRFVNLTELYITYEKSGDLHLAELGLLADRQSGRQNLGEAWNFKSLLQIEIFDFLLCLAKILHCFSNFNAFLTLSQGKHFYKVVLNFYKALWFRIDPYYSLLPQWIINHNIWSNFVAISSCIFMCVSHNHWWHVYIAMLPWYLGGSFSRTDGI